MSTSRRTSNFGSCIKKTVLLDVLVSSHTSSTWEEDDFYSEDGVSVQYLMNRELPTGTCAVVIIGKNSVLVTITVGWKYPENRSFEGTETKAFRRQTCIYLLQRQNQSYYSPPPGIARVLKQWYTKARKQKPVVPFIRIGSLQKRANQSATTLYSPALLQT